MHSKKLPNFAKFTVVLTLWGSALESHINFEAFLNVYFDILSFECVRRVANPG